MKAYFRYAGLLFLTVILAIPAIKIKAVEGKSPFDPASAGVLLSGIVECGRGYTSHELYDMKITLQDVIRGTEAWKRLRQASNENKPADKAYEYILARVKFEYYARGKPGLCIHKLSPNQFIACSSDGEEYPVTLMVLPEPEMRGEMHSGDSLEGWVALLIPKSDKTPLLYYTADAGKAVMHGGNMWFKLYN